MASYDTIVQGARTVWPGFTFSYGGECQGQTYQWPEAKSTAAPPSTTRHYQPVVESQSRSDPTKGSKRNWTAIKKSGEISFTPLSASKSKVENFVIEKPHRLSSWIWRANACNTTIQYDGGVQQGFTDYVEKSDIQVYVSSSGPGIGSRFSAERESLESDVRDAISTTQQAAYAQAMSTYDLLTEMAEARETLAYMQSTVGSAAEALRKLAYTDEPTYRRARGMTARDLLKSSDKALRRFGSRWMEYRYAIMPLIYTLKDVNELLGQRDAVYKTGRQSESLSFSLSPSDFEMPQNGILTFGVGTMNVKVSSVFKARYDRGALQRVFAQTSFNPFKTGWELVPYSFVVDWFLNVGDAITAATTVDLSTQSVGCTAIKRKINYEVHHFDNVPDVSTRTISPWMNYPERKYSYTFDRNFIGLLQRQSTESYDRFIFNRPQPAIHFDMFLNWKRMLDGLVLTYQPIKKLLRSL